MVATWQRSWALVKLSWRILRQDRFLALYPVIALGLMLALGLVALVLVAMMIAIVGAYQDGQLHFLALSPVVQFIGILFLAAFIWGIIIIAMYSEVALAGAIQRGFAGMPRTLRDGFAVANARWRGIVEYSAISAVVSVIVILLQAIASLPRTGAAGAEFATLLSLLLTIGWSIVTCLVAPVLAAENISGVNAIRRCRDLLRFTWGRQISGAIWMWACLWLAILVVGVGYFILSALLLAIAHVFFLAVFSTIVFFVALAGLALIYNTMGNIFSVALYQDTFAGMHSTPQQQIVAPSLAAHTTQFGQPLSRGADISVRGPSYDVRNRPKRG